MWTALVLAAGLTWLAVTCYLTRPRSYCKTIDSSRERVRRALATTSAPYYGTPQGEGPTSTSSLTGANDERTASPSWVVGSTAGAPSMASRRTSPARFRPGQVR